MDHVHDYPKVSCLCDVCYRDIRLSRNCVHLRNMVQLRVDTTVAVVYEPWVYRIHRLAQKFAWIVRDSYVCHVANELPHLETVRTTRKGGVGETMMRNRKPKRDIRLSKPHTRRIQSSGDAGKTDSKNGALYFWTIWTIEHRLPVSLNRTGRASKKRFFDILKLSHYDEAFTSRVQCWICPNTE